MADEPQLENILIISTTFKEPHLAVYLVPKITQDEVTRKMALPANFTYSFSLAGAKLIEIGPMDKFRPTRAYSLTMRSFRSPFLHLEQLELQYRTKWMGKAEDTINDEIDQILEVLHRLRDESLRVKFPPRDSGEAS